MDQYSGTTLEIPYFEVTRESTIVSKGIGKDLNFIETIHGKVTTTIQANCPKCGCVLVFNQYLYIQLHHLTLFNTRIVLDVQYKQYLCEHCHKTATQEIPFKEEGHNITTTLLSCIIGFLTHSHVTIQGISKAFRTSWRLVKDIDKKRLTEQYGEMKPTHYSKYLCVDEFSLHKGHRYATVVLDWQTGEILFLEEGNSEQQLHHFFKKVGHEWMQHVHAIAMDMNAQYVKAVRARYHHIAVVYDAFHIVKNFNDRILTELRRQEQRELQTKIYRDSQAVQEMKKHLKEVEDAHKGRILDAIQEKQLDIQQAKKAYTTLKGSRFILLSSRETLRRKDELAKAHNKDLYDKYDYHGLRVPSHERVWSTRNEQRLDDILRNNNALNIAMFLSEQLKAGLDCPDPDRMHTGLIQWLKLADSYVDDIPMLVSFNKMIRTRFVGIVNRVKFPISNGPLEGVNNMIKTCRRQAYGYRDKEYFFLKIWEKSRTHVKRRSLSAVIQSRCDKADLLSQYHSFCS